MGTLHRTGKEPQPEAVLESSARTYLGVCAIYRDEGPYLREWIELHRLVGVERFFLYDNGSSDDHLEILAPYRKTGPSCCTNGLVRGASSLRMTTA